MRCSLSSHQCKQAAWELMLKIFLQLHAFKAPISSVWPPGNHCKYIFCMIVMIITGSSISFEMEQESHLQVIVWQYIMCALFRSYIVPLPMFLVITVRELHDHLFMISDIIHNKLGKCISNFMYWSFPGYVSCNIMMHRVTGQNRSSHVTPGYLHSIPEQSLHT